MTTKEQFLEEIEALTLNSRGNCFLPRKFYEHVLRFPKPHRASNS